MKFWPADDLVFVTALDEKEVRHRMLLLVKARNASYTGDVNGNNFRIRRDIQYRNSFLPIVSGTIEPGIGTTMLRVKMRMHLFVTVFEVLWLTISFSFALLALFQPAREAVVFPLMFCVGGYAMAMIAFYLEARIVKRDFRNTFAAHIQGEQ